MAKRHGGNRELAKHAPYKNDKLSEMALPAHLALQMSLRRVERVSAYREMQALSNVIRASGSQNFESIDDFALYDNMVVRPVEDDEVRVVVQDKAYIVNKRNSTTTAVMPPSAAALAATQGVNLIVVGLDQGLARSRCMIVMVACVVLVLQYKTYNVVGDRSRFFKIDRAQARLFSMVIETSNKSPPAEDPSARRRSLSQSRNEKQ